MKKSTKNLAKITLLVCAVLCAALVLAHFVPYWTPTQEVIDSVKASYDEDKVLYTGSLSIFQFLFLPSDYPVMEEYLGTDDFKPTDPVKVINNLAGTFCVAFLLAAVYVVIYVLKSDKLWICLFPLAIGVVSFIGYLTEPMWALGSIYIVLVILSGLIAAVSIVPLVIWFISISNWFKDPKTLPQG